MMEGWNIGFGVKHIMQDWNDGIMEYWVWCYVYFAKELSQSPLNSLVCRDSISFIS